VVAPLVFAVVVVIVGVVPGGRRALPAALYVPAAPAIAPILGQGAGQDTVCLAASSWRHYADLPVFTPYTLPPALKNRDEVRRALVAEYPPALRDAGVGGTTFVWLHIDECGGVMGGQVKLSSGNGAIDAAALRVAARMRWTPGYNGEQAVDVWVALPIIFKTTATPGPGDPAVPTAPAAPTAGRCDALEWPISRCEGRPGTLFTPRGYYPLTLRNPSEVDELLKTRYPATLREQGIGGTAVIRIECDPSGFVTAAQVASGSGHDELDRAALAVARALRFFPPRDLAGRYASVTIAVPIRF
jgi:TonB family protein